MSQHLQVVLTPDQHTHLTQLTRSGNVAARVQTRARILLLSDRSPCQTVSPRQTQKEIAAALRVCEVTVGAICRRFALEGMDVALSEKPRPGQKPKITGEIEAELVLLACSDPPTGHARWTMQLLADKLVELKLVESITDTTVCERLKKKRAQAVADEAVLHRIHACVNRQTLGTIRSEDGGRSGSVRASL